MGYFGMEFQLLSSRGENYHGADVCALAHINSRTHLMSNHVVIDMVFAGAFPFQRKPHNVISSSIFTLSQDERLACWVIISADDRLKFFFSYFSEEKGFDISCLHEISNPIFSEK